MRTQTLFTKYAPPAILAVSLLVTYLSSMAPGLTWANDGSDGGDLITAAATGGVAHPTGYPLYLLAARVFQLTPIGSLAFRTNLMSAIAAALASVLVYALVISHLPASDERSSWLPGLISAYAFGLSPLIWSQAVITEVYTLHALFVVLVLYLSSGQAALKLAQKKLDLVLGLTFGLAIGNHVTSILLLPILFFPTISRGPTINDESRSTGKWQPDKNSALRRLTWLGAGVLIYLTLPLRALSKPPVNWGNSITLNGFIWLVSGKLYQDQLFVVTLASAWARIRSAAGLLIEQFGIPGLILGLIGVIVFYKPSPFFRNAIWVVSVFSIFAIGYATRDSYVYLIPSFLCFAMWIGLGTAGLMELFSRKVLRIEIALGIIIICYFFLLASSNWRQVDASKDTRAEDFGRNVLAQAPANAIVFAKGDKAIFTMWYFHFAMHNRPDLAVVVTDLLGFDWYQGTLGSAYPDLVLPGPFPFAEVMISENPERPVCYIEYMEFAKIDCVPAQEARSP
ncbi:MAG: DUF2723 domain-containing protein [Chloroflexi bacterium]|nr:DUF2723 domain-containing protein [Chloroflexota bacterium]